MNKLLKKKFSLAVSFGQITPKEYIILLDKYKEYICDVYFSPTESIRYQTRNKIYDFATTTNEERRSMLREVLSFASGYDIACHMTLNAPMVSAIEQAYIYKSYSSLFKIDRVTTTIEIARHLREQNPNLKLICSYNEGITTKKHLLNIIDSDLFDAIVLGGRFLRDIKTFKLIKERGLKTILMLNTGCCMNCASFCKIRNSTYCIDLFSRNANKMDVELMYATQSIFPEEIRDFYLQTNAIDTYKLASRPIDYWELDRLLESYISCNSKSYIVDSETNYHLYGRLAHFIPYYQSFNYESIMSIKKKLWQTS